MLNTEATNSNFIDLLLDPTGARAHNLPHSMWTR